MKQSTRLSLHPSLVYVVLAWGLNFSVVKIAEREFSAESVAVLRYLGMLPLLLIVTRMRGLAITVPPSDRLKALWAGFVGSGAYMVLFLVGMSQTSAGHGAIALATAPIWIGILAIVTRQEAFRWNLLVGSVIAFCGVAIAISAGGVKGTTTPFGAAVVLASAVTWAYSVILMKPLLAKHPPLTVFSAGFPGAALALIPYGLHGTLATHWSSITWAGWLSLAYLVVIAGVGAFAAYYQGVADVGASRASLTQYFVPPTALLGAWLLFRDPLTPVQLFGAAVVIAGVFFASRKPSDPNVNASEEDVPKTPCEAGQ